MDAAIPEAGNRSSNSNDPFALSSQFSTRAFPSNDTDLLETVIDTKSAPTVLQQADNHSTVGLSLIDQINLAAFFNHLGAIPANAYFQNTNPNGPFYVTPYIQSLGVKVPTTTKQTVLSVAKGIDDASSARTRSHSKSKPRFVQRLWP